MNFTYNDYLENSAKNQANRDNKIGYFKLGDGEEALARFNISSIDSLKFATVHKAKFEQRYAGLVGFGGVYCLNPIIHMKMFAHFVLQHSKDILW